MRHAARNFAAALALPLLAAALVGASPAQARSTDRNQPMDIDADGVDAQLDDDSVTTLTGNVRIRQGSLDVRADRGEVHRGGGEIRRLVLTGAPATLHQINDSGEAMDASARQIVYTVDDDIMVLTGDVLVRQPRGDLRGQTVKYNLATGRLDGGGDGGRVSMRILPKPAAKTD